VGTAKRERQKAGRQARLQALQAQQAKQKRNRTVLRVGGFVVAFLAVVTLIAVFTHHSSSNNASTATTAPAVTDSVAPATTASGPTTTAKAAPFPYGTGACPPATGAPAPVTSFAQPFQKCLATGKTYSAVFDTSEGTIGVLLDTTRTPGTTNNFVSLARSKYYDGTTIFRTAPNIDIIQGGGKTNTDTPGYAIPDEGGKFTYTEGLLVMARTSQPNSGGAQWFFTSGPKVSALDGQGTYVVFGKVTAGLDVIKKIQALSDDPTDGKPKTAVTVKSVTIQEN
jgi:peptidyl-prolyl cis-trans isomerase B (cyclophilin B)